MASNDHVTKADLKTGLDGLRDELKGDMKALKDELRDELTEMMRGIETKLLSAFYGFAESTQQRLTQHDGFNERLGTLERRLTDLEKKVNFPHAS